MNHRRAKFYVWPNRGLEGVWGYRAFGKFTLREGRFCELQGCADPVFKTTGGDTHYKTDFLFTESFEWWGRDFPDELASAFVETEIPEWVYPLLSADDRLFLRINGITTLDGVSVEACLPGLMDCLHRLSVGSEVLKEYEKCLQIMQGLRRHSAQAMGSAVSVALHQAYSQMNGANMNAEDEVGRAVRREILLILEAWVSNFQKPSASEAEELL